MKHKKTAHPKSAAPAAEATWNWQPYAWAAAAIVLVFWAYGPALNGAFVFDDTVLPYARPTFSPNLSAWVADVRKALMFSYWVSKQMAGPESTYAFHVMNLLIHLVSGGLIFLV